MINPEEIPRFTGRLEELEKVVGALSADGSGFTSTGTAIHSRFQSLSSYYQAPEAEKLFATTAAVQTTGESLGSDVESVARALGEYANEIRPLVARLDDLREQAVAFAAEARSDDGPLNGWQRDQEKVDKNAALVNGVTAASLAFWDAERTAANKIMALFSCIKYQANDGSNKPGMYGYSADALKDAELPWGTVEERAFLPGNIDRHIKSFVWDGLILDNIVGTVQGLGALVGIGADASDTWNALGRVFLGAGDYVRDPHNERPGGLGDLPVVQESRKDAKEFAKGLVAWDMWSENPTRASATVVFNVLTIAVAPLKAGTAAKAGLAAKTAGTAAKIGGYSTPSLQRSRPLEWPHRRSPRSPPACARPYRTSPTRRTGRSSSPRATSCARTGNSYGRTAASRGRARVKCPPLTAPPRTMPLSFRTGLLRASAQAPTLRAVPAAAMLAILAVVVRTSPVKPPEKSHQRHRPPLTQPIPAAEQTTVNQTSTIWELVATTKRGLLPSRQSHIRPRLQATTSWKREIRSTSVADQRQLAMAGTR